jgi:hypothetical protein
VIGCAGSGYPSSSEPSWIRIEGTGRASDECTATTQMDMLGKLRECYDTRTGVMQVLCINLFITLDYVL